MYVCLLWTDIWIWFCQLVCHRFLLLVTSSLSQLTDPTKVTFCYVMLCLEAKTLRRALSSDNSKKVEKAKKVYGYRFFGFWFLGFQCSIFGFLVLLFLCADQKPIYDIVTCQFSVVTLFGTHFLFFGYASCFVSFSFVEGAENSLNLAWLVNVKTS